VHGKEGERFGFAWRIARSKPIAGTAAIDTKPLLRYWQNAQGVCAWPL
jgi:hypothetical protein